MSTALFRRLAALVVLAMFGAAACGVTNDSLPSALPRNQIPDSLVGGQLPTPGPQGDVDGEGQSLFMVGPDNRLIEVSRGVGDTPRAVMDSLLVGTTLGEGRQGISSAITRSTTIPSVEFNPLFQLAIVTLGPNSLSSDSEEQLLAFGQIVFTLTALDGIESVLFQTVRDAESGVAEVLPVQTDLGVTEPGQQVRRADYASIDPGRDLIAFPVDDDLAPSATPTVDNDRQGPLMSVPIWVLNNQDQLVQLTRRVERSNDAILQSLFDGLLASEASRGLRSAVPEDANPRRIETFEVVERDGIVANIAVVDLAVGSLPPFEAGDDRVLAVAQIVYTLTGLAEIDEVLISIDGVPTPMPTQFGLSEPYDEADPIGLRRSDYAAYAPSVVAVDRVGPNPTPTTTATPTPTATPVP